MKALRLSASCEMFQKKIGAKLHLITIHVENFRSQARGAIAAVFYEHHLGVGFAGIVVVPAYRGNLEAFFKQVAKPGEHLHTEAIPILERKVNHEHNHKSLLPWDF